MSPRTSPSPSSLMSVCSSLLALSPFPSLLPSCRPMSLALVLSCSFSRSIFLSLWLLHLIPSLLMSYSLSLSLSLSLSQDPFLTSSSSLLLSFSEMPTNNFVESSFWNFDSLFQPQQHPARDQHDTFFMSGQRPVPSIFVVLFHTCILQSNAMVLMRTLVFMQFLALSMYASTI